MKTTPWRRHALAATLITAVAVLASGCTNTETKPELPPLANVQLHPNGDQGSWLKDAYANGSTQTYATVDTVCGLSSDLIFESRGSLLYGPSVIARNVTTRTIAWEVPGACWRDSFTPGIGLVVRNDDLDTPLQLVDPLNGAVLASLPKDLSAFGTRPLTTAGDITVYETDVTTIVGVRNEQLVWTYSSATRADFYALADGKIGITNGLNDVAIAVDGATGKELFRRELTDSSRKHTWASDGLVVIINQSDPEYAYVGIDGAEVDRTKGVSQYPFVPSPSDGVTFPLADHIAAGTIVAVAADGSPAFFEGPQRKDFTRAGQIDLAQGESILDVRATSADGQLFLVDLSDADGVEVRDDKGATVFTWIGDDHDVRVMGGYIVVTGDLTTSVLLPGR